MSSTSEKPTLPEKLGASLRRLGVEPTASLVVAVSAGADSTALLAALRECAGTARHLTAVHVDHGIRPPRERARDLALLRALSLRLGVELVVERVNEGQILETASAAGRSVEEVAREVRYERLRALAGERAAGYIAVAHTLDDQLETILMRLFRGGLLQGLSGIPAARGCIIRPLLGCTRGEVLRYLRMRRIPYREDSTNRDERYLRNLVRRRLVPAVLRVFPSARASVESFVSRMVDLNASLDALSATMLPWRRSGDCHEIASAQFFAAPGELRVRSALRLFNEAGRSRRISRAFLRPLEEAKHREGRSVILRGYGVIVEQAGDTVFWRPDVVVNRKKSYLMRVFEPTRYHITPTFSFTVRSVPKESTGGARIGLPESFVRHPLVVRSRKPGDTIQMKDGTKSLKKLLNDWGVRESLRDLVPIVEDRDGVWAVGGGAFGYQDRTRYRPVTPGAGDSCERTIVFTFEYSGDDL